MGCCGKGKHVVRSAAKTARQVATGYANLVRGKEYDSTKERVRMCRRCDDHYWIKHALFCSICKCYIPAKARVKESTCPNNLWPS